MGGLLNDDIEQQRDATALARGDPEEGFRKMPIKKNEERCAASSKREAARRERGDWKADAATTDNENADGASVVSALAPARGAVGASVTSAPAPARDAAGADSTPVTSAPAPERRADDASVSSAPTPAHGVGGASVASEKADGAARLSYRRSRLRVARSARPSRQRPRPRAAPPA